jgi:hypothetical protein
VASSARGGAPWERKSTGGRSAAVVMKEAYT